MKIFYKNGLLTLALFPIISILSSPEVNNSLPVPQQFNAGGRGYGPSRQQFNDGYRRVQPLRFLQPPPLLDPKYPMKILGSYHRCRRDRCGRMKVDYKPDIQETIAGLGQYTSCIITCASIEMLNGLQYIRRTVEDTILIAAERLETARSYVAGDDEEYDVIGNRTRIEGSCCLPSKKFASWDQILMAVHVNGNDFDHMVQVDTYLRKCASAGDYDEERWDVLYPFECDPNWAAYLLQIRQNIGGLILKPFEETGVRDSLCNPRRDKNPQAEPFNHDVCIAAEIVVDGSHARVKTPLIKPVLQNTSYYESCPPDVRNIISPYEELPEPQMEVIYYDRVPAGKLKYYTVVTGFPSAVALPSGLELQFCQYTQGLASYTPDGSAFQAVPAPDSAASTAVQQCPEEGRFEYCSMEQYVNYLETQLFSTATCSAEDLQNAAVFSDSESTLVCMHSMLSMKLACMEAVSQCYAANSNFTDPIGQSFGQTSSILCGYILCQKPTIYSLFGGENGVQHALIMRQLLENVGLSTTVDFHAAPPALIGLALFVVGAACTILFQLVHQGRHLHVQTSDGSIPLI